MPTICLGAVLLLLTGLPACAQRATHWERARAEWIHWIDPSAAGSGEGQIVTGVIPLADERELGLLGRRRFNEAIGEIIGQQLGHRPDEVLSSLSLTCYGVPTGSLRRSEVRGNLRLQDLKLSLSARLGVENVAVAWVPEDWESIARLTRHQPGLLLQAAALDIMEHVGVGDGREAQLKALGGGETYRQLQQQVFPAVQRVEYRAAFSHRTPVPADGVTLRGLYATVSAHAGDTAVCHDLIDLAARLFPENAAAAVNAAGVALLRGDTARAEEYLRRWEKDGRACLHLGVLHLLQGHMSRAEVYLRLAEAQGLAEASAALEALAAADTE